MSFLRFVAFERQRPYSASYGPFSLAYALADDSGQPAYYRRSLREQIDWFEEYLPVPDMFNRRLGRASAAIGVCWFKDGAARHISRMRDMCFVIVEIGYAIDFRWAVEPGRQIYEDDFQIVAHDHTRPAHEYWN